MNILITLFMIASTGFFLSAIRLFTRIFKTLDFHEKVLKAVNLYIVGKIRDEVGEEAFSRMEDHAYETMFQENAEMIDAEIEKLLRGEGKNGMGKN